jgi:hypothetical protein
MIYKANKGQTSYGEVIGILMLDTYTPFIPGDVGNASTYDFPVKYETVKGLTVKKIFNKDESAYDSLFEAAQILAKQGVRAITGDCGFMAIYQEKLANDLDIPVFLSSMLQVPFILNIISKDKKLAIISANGKSIDDKNLLKKVEIKNRDNIIIRGLENKESFNRSIIEENGKLNFGKIKFEVVEEAKDIVSENEDIASFLLECSVLPPYAKAIQDSVHLPVFDYITMIKYVYSAVVQKEYNGVY